jgi:hypothetical protein
MGVPARGRARRVEPSLEIAKQGRAPGYAGAFAVDVADADVRSAEQWAGSIFEGAPRFLRWFVVLGWKLVLRLRLAPAGTDGTIAGWTQVGEATPASITLEVSSSLVTGRKVLQVESNRVTVATYVWYENRRGRVLWSSITPVHHRIEPLLLTSAASRHRADTADGPRQR